MICPTGLQKALLCPKGIPFGLAFVSTDRIVSPDKMM